MLEMQRVVETARDDVIIYKDRVDTFEGIVKIMGIEKRKNQTMCQENMKLSVQLKELENEIKTLQEMLRKQKLSACQLLTEI